LEGDQGSHNLAVVLRLSDNLPGRPSDRLVIWFDWYGKASDVQSFNDGYRDYGFVPTPETPHTFQYRIKGFRGSPPVVNLKAFLEDASQRGLPKVSVVNGVWFGNEIWDGSRGATLVTKLDLVINSRRCSSVPAKAAQK
jgi:hypothetical protein